MASDGWGTSIKAMLEVDTHQRIVHEIGHEGCCAPAVCCGTCCPATKARSYIWLTEHSIEENVSCFVCLDCFRCKFCTTGDYVSKTFYDREPFAPACCGLCKPGFATEEDLNYCCYCINCVCCYNMCKKPCCGGEVRVVPCPRDTCGFTCITRCLPCFTSPLMTCISDSASAAQKLQETVAVFEARKVAKKSGTSNYPVVKAPGAQMM
jgi:hypothetical protein